MDAHLMRIDVCGGKRIEKVTAVNGDGRWTVFLNVVDFCVVLCDRLRSKQERAKIVAKSSSSTEEVLYCSLSREAIA
jgi:hypothetical protein